MKWFVRFAESVKHYLGKKTSTTVTNGWEDLPTGSSKRARDECIRWIKSSLDTLDDICDERTRNQILVETCPHTYPKTRIKKMRAEFERLGNIDDLVELMRNDTSWGGGSYYDYPVRKSDEIHITKVPFNPKTFEKAVSDDEKRQAYCHCTLVKHSKVQISSTFCCCSGGWIKQLWEGIFGQPVQVKLIESLLSGDTRCTHSVQIPKKFL